MIPALFCEDSEQVGIPILETEGFAWITWAEEETFEDFIKKFSKYSSHYASFSVWGQHDENDEYRKDGTFHLVIYAIEDKHEKEYFLISSGGITEFDDLKNCVCIPRNELNLLKFFAEYALPFSNKNLSYFYG